MKPDSFHELPPLWFIHDALRTMRLQCRVIASLMKLNGLDGKDRGRIHMQSLNSPTGTEDIQENPQ
jgi:hypothetical protein